LTEKELEP